MVAGRPVSRDRDAEFRAEGTVEDLAVRTAAARLAVERDIGAEGFDPMAPPAGTLGPEDAMVPYSRTKGAVLLHIMEELLQHLGQMEITRDVILAGR